MFSYKRSLPPSQAFEPQTLGSEPLSDADMAAAGLSRPTGHSPNRSALDQEITVLLLNDTPLTRECLSMSLNLCDRGLRVLTAASPADVEAMRRSETGLDADVVLCHLGGAPPSDPRSLSVLGQLLGMLGETPLIVLSDCEEPNVILDTFRLGVRGYIPTSVGLSMALEAIRLVGAGGTFLPASFLQRLVRDPIAPVPVAPIDVKRPERSSEAAAPPSPAGRSPESPTGCSDERLNGLTPRQLAVLACLREGKANKVIAYELGMCESTVKVHVRNILKKLGATNRTQAAYLTFGQPSH